MTQNVDFNSIDDRVKNITVVSVEVDSKYANKCYVVLDIPINSKNGVNNLDQVFRLDSVKQIAINAAEEKLHRSCGWSDVSRLNYIKDGKPVHITQEADSCQVKFTILSMP